MWCSVARDLIAVRTCQLHLLTRGHPAIPDLIPYAASYSNEVSSELSRSERQFQILDPCILTFGLRATSHHVCFHNGVHGPVRDMVWELYEREARNKRGVHLERTAVWS